jgi:peptidoglycan/LPS O-acetylase OafA/YrhL
LVGSDRERPSVRFEPLRPASRGQLIAGFIVGPILWLVVLIVAAWLFDYSRSVAYGLLLTVAAFLVSLLVLALVHVGRRRQEERYANRG